MELPKGYTEIQSATPEEIRAELGLPPEASRGEVIAERTRLFDRSVQELVARRVQIDGGTK